MGTYEGETICSFFSFGNNVDKTFFVNYPNNFFTNSGILLVAAELEWLSFRVGEVPSMIYKNYCYYLDSVKEKKKQQQKEN